MQKCSDLKTFKTVHKNVAQNYFLYIFRELSRHTHTKTSCNFVKIYKKLFQTVHAYAFFMYMFSFCTKLNSGVNVTKWIRFVPLVKHSL